MEKLHFAWLDADMYNEQNQQLLKEMRQLHSDTMEFKDEDECLRFIGRGVADPRAFVFIVSGRLGESLVPNLHDRENILSIYIYCGYREKHEKWSNKYKKCHVVTSHEELLGGLKSEQNSYNKK